MSESRPKKRGSPRQDLSIEYWLQHSDNLLKHIPQKRRISKKIKENIAILKSVNISTEESNECLESLNGFKNDLGKDWLKWRNRISQQSKDKKREVLYPNPSVSKLLSEQANSSDNSKPLRYIHDITLAVSELGIKIPELYDLKDLLQPFESALKQEVSFSLHDNTPDKLPYSINTILKKLIHELKANGISNFKDISTIRSRLRKVKKKEQIVNEQAKLNDFYVNDIINLNREIEKLNKENEELNTQARKAHLKGPSMSKNTNKTRSRFANKRK
jgi:hypothetical protein